MFGYPTLARMEFLASNLNASPMRTLCEIYLNICVTMDTSCGVYLLLLEVLVELLIDPITERFLVEKLMGVV